MSALTELATLRPAPATVATVNGHTPAAAPAIDIARLASAALVTLAVLTALAGLTGMAVAAALLHPAAGWAVASIDLLITSTAALVIDDRLSRRRGG